MIKTVSRCEKLTLINFMKDRGKWVEEMENEIPRCFEKYGGHLLFPEPSFANKNWNDAGEDLWILTCKLFNGNAIAVRGRIQSDGYRSPTVRFLYGNSTLVNYIDNHIKYSWDIEKNMFCAGNISERHRIANRTCEDEVIVDLFAGIGYFTLPYLVHSKAKFVHACEWNVNAIEALKKNLELNAVADKCQIHEGDNKQVSPQKVANRVNLGLIPSSEEYWPVAFAALLEIGGILYIHHNVTSKFYDKSCSICDQVISSFNITNNDKLYQPFECFIEEKLLKWNKLPSYSLKCKKPEWFLFAIHIIHCITSILKGLYTNIWKVSVGEIFKVKSYAPHIDHLVYTVHCNPLST